MVGKFATSGAGHDKGTLYVIVAEENGFVYLSDGRLKTVAKPKKKLLKHIQVINHTVDAQLAERLRKKEKVLDEQIKYAIKQYNKV